MKYITYLESPVGNLELAEDGMGICSIAFGKYQRIEERKEKETFLLIEAKKQLKEYFSGKRRMFNLPFSINGTAFQKMVWNALCTIPYGETRTYQQIAEQIGRPKACRAVGMANHVNPISIVIPCHRVIGANGKLIGYGGGLDKKEKLLNLEAENKEQRKEEAVGGDFDFF